MIALNIERKAPAKVPFLMSGICGDAESMRVAVVVSDEEFGLTIVSVDDVGHLESELLQTLPCLVDIGRCPVEADAIKVFRCDYRPGSPVEPKIVFLVVHHATDQLAFNVHFPVHGKAQGFDPKAQAFPDVGAGDYGYTGFDGHRREVNEFFYVAFI